MAVPPVCCATDAAADNHLRSHIHIFLRNVTINSSFWAPQVKFPTLGCFLLHSDYVLISGYHDMAMVHLRLNAQTYHSQTTESLMNYQSEATYVLEVHRGTLQHSTWGTLQHIAAH